MIRVSNLSIAQAKYLVETGTEVYMPCLVEADESILEEAVMEGLPARTYIDENEVERVCKYKDWGGASFQPLLRSDDGRVLLCCTINFEYIKASEWLLFENMEGVTLHNNESYQELKKTSKWQGQ